MSHTYSGKQIITWLLRRGFFVVSQKGSHVKLRCGQLTVIVPDHRELAYGTLRSILKQSALSIDELRDEVN